MIKEQNQPIPLGLGAALQIIREARNFTIKDVSYASKISTRSIKRIEKGVQVPRMGTIERLARVFDMTPEEFFMPDRRNTYR